MERRHLLLDGRGGEEAGRLVCRALQGFLQDLAGAGLRVDAVGACVPGIYHAHSGLVWAPNIPGWEAFPLLERLGAVAEGVSVFVDSDRSCYILGEAWQGAAAGCRHAIYVSVGTGIGAGILCGGEVLRGAHDIAGAIGWLALRQPYRAVYDACGCFEYHASGSGIPGFAREVISTMQGYAGPLAGTGPITAADVFEAYDSKDPVALAVVSGCVTFWGMALANLVSIFDPERVVFGGGVFGPAVRFLPDITGEARRWAQPVSFSRVEVVASALGGDAGLYGAARLALASIEKLRHAE